MRLRLFLICLIIVIFSLAGGLGLQYVQAVWTEPGATPPNDNVAAPVNVGGLAQTKVGDLTIGGNFTVNGTSGGNVCHLVGGTWYSCPGTANAFVDEGNSGFGPTAVLGTIDNVPLSFETNSVGRMYFDTSGKVGIGTTGPLATLHISGARSGVGLTRSLFIDDTWSNSTVGGGREGLSITANSTNTGAGNIDITRGLMVNNPTLTGAHTNLVGIGIAEQTAGVNNTDLIIGSGGSYNNPTGNFALYSASTRNSYFAGSVGIGTASPSAKLVVEGGQAIFNNSGGNEYIVINSAGSSQASVILQRAGTTKSTIYNNSTVDALVLTDGANTDTMAIKSGNVGIGLMSPDYKLVVAGVSPRTYIYPTNLGGNPELDFGDSAYTNHWGIYRANDDSSNQLRFWYGARLSGVGENNVTMTAAGDIDSRRCFGPVYVGQTAATYNGARGGYTSANALCAASVSGSHVCTTSEILETIKCNQPSLPTTDQAWISNGPPGYTARANDCTGWTSTSPSGATTVYGAIWAFDASGGVGWVTTCNQSLKFACCK